MLFDLPFWLCRPQPETRLSAVIAHYFACKALKSHSRSLLDFHGQLCTDLASLEISLTRSKFSFKREDLSPWLAMDLFEWDAVSIADGDIFIKSDLFSSLICFPVRHTKSCMPYQILIYKQRALLQSKSMADVFLE